MKGLKGKFDLVIQNYLQNLSLILPLVGLLSLLLITTWPSRSQWAI